LNGAEFAGSYNNPEWRGNVSISWKRNTIGAAIYVNYIGAYQHREPQFVAGDIQRDFRVNLSLHHDDILGWRVSGGVNNLLNEDPPFDPSSFWAYNPGVHSGEKAFVYLRLAKDW
jgi:outer membrane receptor protein involved in Fe transport